MPTFHRLAATSQVIRSDAFGTRRGRHGRFAEFSSSNSVNSSGLDVIGNFKKEWKEVQQLNGVVAKFKHLFGKYGLWFPAIYFGPFWLGPFATGYFIMQAVRPPVAFSIAA